ncbi:DUF4382 domain-containing protein [Galbibacter sp.]|jgi:hypothetical protein|uniref:DUF4382 domain-containing protein n=1 Tax=Galbibacter sp. TaxID=2918471 RepID=UPI003A942D24
MKIVKGLSSSLLILFSLLFIASSCSDDDNDTNIPGDGTAKVQVLLVDAPGDYEEVNVDIQDVMINRTDEAENGWESLTDVETGVYDLLKLTGGNHAILADNELPTGELDQIRLVLGDNNYVVIDGQEVPLATPSAQQSGLKIHLDDTELEAGFTYSIVLDFDADKSVVKAGESGSYNLKPVINASWEVNSGQITGSVNPQDFQTVASVITADNDTISSYTSAEGIYTLYGVPAGTYEVTLTPEAESGYAVTTVADVVVVNGEITEVPLTELEAAVEGGSISGTVLNADAEVTASVTVGEEVVSTTVAEDGTFTLEGIPAGTYTLTLTSAEGSAFGVNTIPEVVVVDNEVTAIGDITLE